MKYSDKLNGYWEEGYHYYFEIRGKSFTLRDASKRVVFETDVKYDAKKLESGEKTELKIGETTLARTYKGEPMWYITGLYYENGIIHMDTHYTITGDSSYDLHKVDHGPFYNLLVLDDKYLDMLQGEWVQWRPDGSKNSTVRIIKNEIRFLYNGSVLDKANFHVIAYRSSPERPFISSEDLTVHGIGMYNELKIEPGMLTGYEMVCDMDMPLSVFARRDMIDKIDIPPAALRKPRNTMIYEPMVDETPVIKVKEDKTYENDSQDKQ